MSKRQIVCPKCQTQMQVDASAGRIRCPKCQAVLNLGVKPNAGSPPAGSAGSPPAANPFDFGSLPDTSGMTPSGLGSPSNPAPRFAAPPYKTSPPGPGVPSATQGRGTEPSAEQRKPILLLAVGLTVGLFSLLIIGGLTAWGLGAFGGGAGDVTNNENGGVADAVTAMQPLPPAGPLPDRWQNADVLGAQAVFPTGAIEKTRDDQTATYAVQSAETSSFYRLCVLLQPPPGEDALATLKNQLSEEALCGVDWQPTERGGVRGFRSESISTSPPRVTCISEAYPLETGWVTLTYQSFSSRDPAKRPKREVREDEALVDVANSFFASLRLPNSLPASTTAMNTAPEFRKLGEAQKKQLYQMYKVSAKQADQKIKIPKGYARARVEDLLDGILKNEVQKMTALFDVSEAELYHAVAEGQALGW